MGLSRRTLGFVAGSTLSAAFVAGCGSTAPVAPTAPSAVPAQAAASYPSLVGEWGGGMTLVVQFVDASTPQPYHCNLNMTVKGQAEGTFSGSGFFIGSSINSDKECPSGLGFTARMTADGTIVAFTAANRFSSHECLAMSDLAFTSGTASSAGFKVQMTDRAQCRWPPLIDPRDPVKDASRTFTIVIDQRRGPLPTP